VGFLPYYYIYALFKEKVAAKTAGKRASLKYELLPFQDVLREK